MVKITQKIANINNSDYPKIMLRKFFQMFFVSEDGKRLSIYTATVFGGLSGETENFCPTYKKGKDCTLKFEYDCGECREDCSINHVDLTKSLWKQHDALTKVWGTIEELSTQQSVQTKLKDLYDKDIKTVPNMRAERPAYYIGEDNKKHHKCVVQDGEYHSSSNPVEYTLSSRSDTCDGLEYMNWVKTEITLPVSIFEDHVNFTISLVDGSYHLFYTPDFTWYYALPEGYNINMDTATVAFYNNSKEERNLIQPVSGETTIHLEEWDEDEFIYERNKFRLLINKSPKFMEDPDSISKGGGLTLGITITNPRRPENRQFVMGLMVAFLLSYCSDKTRINDYCQYTGAVWGLEVIPYAWQHFCDGLVILLPLLAALTYFSIMFSAKKCIPHSKKRKYGLIRWLRRIGILATVLIFIYIFLIGMVSPNIICRLVPSYCGNMLVISILYAIGFICDSVYFGYCVFRRKKKIFDYL